MEIYPENLGPQLEAEVRRERMARRMTADWEEVPFWTRHTIGVALLVSAFLMLLFWLAQLTGMAVLCTVSTFFLFCMYVERALHWNSEDTDASSTSTPQNGIQQPLTSQEIQACQDFRQDSLLRTFLALATHILSAATPDAEAEREVRNALQALGTTVLALPADDPKTVADDPAALRAEAVKLECEAQAEPDAVIGASLQRRAESLTRRADTAARTLLLLRRNHALRQETGEQMDALRTSLTAFRVGGRQTAPELAELAASIQRVAHEANAITAARAEVDTLLTRPLANATVPVGENAVQRVSQ